MTVIVTLEQGTHGTCDGQMPARAALQHSRNVAGRRMPIWKFVQRRKTITLKMSHPLRGCIRTLTRKRSHDSP